MNDWLYKHKIISKIFILVYILFFGWTILWYMNLPSPSDAQTVMITGLFGIGAAWYAQYLRSTRKDCENEETNEEEGN